MKKAENAPIAMSLKAYVAAVAGVCDILKALSQSANRMVDRQFHVGVS